MEIKDIETIEVSIPIIDREGGKNAYLIEITTDEGLVGIGEARSAGIPFGIVPQIVDKCLKPLAVGCSPFDIETLYDKMYRTTQNYGQKGLMIIAISGVEQALWDIIGKVAKQPVYNLVGGCVHKDIEAYASHPHYPTVHEAVKAAKHSIDLGFHAIKFHQREVESSKILRKEAGEDVKIMLDVNGLWTPDEAIKKARELEDYNMTWLECPVYPQEDIDGTAKVTATVGDKVPICAGENDYTIWGFRHYIHKRAVNIINHDTVKCGGFWQAKKIAALAEVAQILCAPHSCCTEVGLEAALHLTTSTPNCAYAEIHSQNILLSMEGLTESILTKPLEVRDGFIQASNKPGFGIELDEGTLNKYRVNK